MTVNKTQIQFHRRSRYEDILELVNDNEEALKPFPNRDAVFYKASNKGSYFDGKDHLDRLKAEQKRINERVVRDHMLREYATDNDLTHRALWDAGAGATDTPVQPEMYNIGTPIEEYGTDEFFDTEDARDEPRVLRDNASFTRAQLEGVIQRAEETRQANQQDIVQAHQQQVEREQQQGDGILRTLGRGTMRVGRNIAGGLASGHDLTTSVIGGLAEPVLSGIGDAVMRRILPQPRPLLDLEAPRTPPNNPWRANPNIAQLPPSIVLQPHQPNVGATQQPLPPAVQQPALPAPIPDVQQGGSRSSRASGEATQSTRGTNEPSSSSSGNFQPHQEEEEEQPKRRPRKRLIKKTNLKESAREDEDVSREDLNMRPLIMPSKIGIQKLRETFEDANNKNAINTTTYRQYRSLYNKWVSNRGVPTAKKEALKELQKLYRETVYNR